MFEDCFTTIREALKKKDSFSSLIFLFWNSEKVDLIQNTRIVEVSFERRDASLHLDS